MFGAVAAHCSHGRHGRLMRGSLSFLLERDRCGFDSRRNQIFRPTDLVSDRQIFRPNVPVSSLRDCDGKIHCVQPVARPTLPVDLRTNHFLCEDRSDILMACCRWGLTWAEHQDIRAEFLAGGLRGWLAEGCEKAGM